MPKEERIRSGACCSSALRVARSTFGVALDLPDRSSAVPAIDPTLALCARATRLDREAAHRVVGALLSALCYVL